MQQDLLDQLDLLEYKVQQEQQVLLDQQVPKVLPDQLDLLDQPDLLEYKVQQEQQDRQVLLEQQALLDRQVHKVQLELTPE